MNLSGAEQHKHVVLCVTCGTCVCPKNVSDVTWLCIWFYAGVAAFCAIKTCYCHVLEQLDNF